MFYKVKTQYSLTKGLALLSLMLVMVALLSACSPKETPKVYKVGIMDGLPFFSPAVEGFKAGMAELGYIEGENITYEVGSSGVDVDEYNRITQGFVADGVDMIFAFPNEATLAAKQATEGTDIPVVFTISFTEVAEGHELVESVSAPGGNITGCRFPSAEISSRRLQIMLEIVPDATRIFVPYFTDYPNLGEQLKSLRNMAEEEGLDLIEFPTTSPDELQAEFDRRLAADEIGIDAIVVVADPVSLVPPFSAVIGKFAYENDIPWGGAPVEVEGYKSLYGLLPDPETAGRQAASLADKVFDGTAAGTIPVVTLEGFLTVNLIAAEEQGFEIPEGLLKQADEILR